MRGVGSGSDGWEERWGLFTKNRSPHPQTHLVLQKNSYPRPVARSLGPRPVASVPSATPRHGVRRRRHGFRHWRPHSQHCCPSMESTAGDPVPNATAPPWSPPPATRSQLRQPYSQYRRRQGRGHQCLGVLRLPGLLHQSKIELSSLNKNRTQTLHHSKIEVSHGMSLHLA
jgi:hypothetical protein